MVRHHPQWRRARELVRGGRIGELRVVQGSFSYLNLDPKNVRNQAGIGGGGLYDIGCYPIVAARFLFGAEPTRVVGQIERDPSFETDRLASALLEFPGGQALFVCSTQLVPYQRMQIFGTKGRIEIEIPFNAPPDRPCRIFVDDGSALGRRLGGRWRVSTSSTSTRCRATRFARCDPRGHAARVPARGRGQQHARCSTRSSARAEAAGWSRSDARHGSARPVRAPRRLAP